MAVNLSKNNLCINQIIEQKNEKITIESDEIVPDIKPDVLSIISSSGNICLCLPHHLSVYCSYRTTGSLRLIESYS